MKLYTKSAFFLKNFYKQGKTKLILFHIHFTNSVFFLFFGFLAGNLFGSVYSLFQNSITWHGFITMLIIFLVEITNYLIYNWSFKIPLYWKNKNGFFYRCGPAKVRRIKNKLSFFSIFKKIEDFCYSYSEPYNKAADSNLKTMFYDKNRYIKFPFTIGSQLLRTFLVFAKNVLEKDYTTVRAVIKSLNLFKIGVLLGFFIDAFKVGS
uniref:Hypothetical chloroplast RF20 n=1 Tax=Prasiolopsis wulf-kochii TaxID=3239232 RepID=A0A097KK06_9CHLO|nr:hypothetical chloroplast RF20 [Prasiolopsis sp. SAG 84.81]